uniref:glycosyltransferase family 39 protein n=1 Tax=Aquabacterium sp. TaxID=1872578 RepID=UPI0027B8A448
LVYACTVAFLQMGASPTAELDQAEQLILSQRLQWGYTNQPPLYTWLLWGLEQWTGPSLTVLLLFKVGLLLALAVSFVGIGHELRLSQRQRVLSLAGLAWLPAFVWEAQRDLTHSMMAATMASLMLWGSLWAVRRRTWWAYALPGAAAAGALLSKHNAVIFVVAVLLTLLSLPDWRRRLHLGGVLFAIALLAGLCAPHGLWLLQHPEVLAQTTHKLIGAQDDAGWVAGGELLVALLKGLLAFLMPWLLVAVPLWWWARRQSAAQSLMTRLLWVVMAVLLVFVLAIGAESFKGRWLFPLLFFVPLWLAASVDVDASRATQIMVRGGVALAVLCGVLLPLRIVWPVAGEVQTRQNLPLVGLGVQLQQTWGAVPPVVLVSHHHVGGNLRLAWGRAPLIQSPRMTWPVALPDEVMVVATDQDLRDPAFATWLRAQTNRAPGDLHWQAVQAPVLHRPQSPPYVLHWARVKRLPDGKHT